jgi:hypothetical protein
MGPMKALTYESPYDRAKGGLRRGLRQITVLCIVCAVLMTFVLRHFNQDSVWYTPADNIVNSIVAGFIAGPVLWFTYRFLRFISVR